MTAGDELLRETIGRYFGAGPEEIDTILQSLAPQHLDGGEWLFRQGDFGDSLYFLIRGRLQVWVKPEAAPADAEPTLLGEIVPGESVGEISLLTGAARTASIRAIRDSQLVRVGRAEFDALALRHPALVMQLAGSVATVLRQRTSRPLSATRGFKAIALVQLGTDQRTRAFCAELGAALGRHGPTLELAPAMLGAQGAPVARLLASEPVPPPLRAWLHDQENANRFVLYQCDAASTPWTVFAAQQSDVVVFVGNADSDPAPAAGEAALVADTDATNARRMLVLLQPPREVPIVGTAAWLEPRRLDFHLHVRADEPDDVERVARTLAGTAIGLVLAGGAARGFAHFGLHKALKEVGIGIDWIGGTSIGAIMGACIATGWTPEEAIARGRDAFTRRNPFGDYTIPLISLVRGRRMERALAEHLPGRIEDMPIPFFAVSCNLDSGSLNLHESGPTRQALRASAALPGVMPPAVIAGQLAVDGAVLNNMPVDIMQTKPVGRIIAVDLASQKTYHVPYDSVPSPWAVLGGRLLPFLRKYRVPSLTTLMLKATELGTMARVRELGKRADLLLQPPVRQFGMMNVKDYDRIVDAGYRYGMEILPQWKATQDSTHPR